MPFTLFSKTHKTGHYESFPQSAQIASTSSNTSAMRNASVQQPLSTQSLNFRPGGNPVCINGQQVARHAVSENGFFSACALVNASTLSRRQPVQARDMQAVLQQMPELGAQAARQMRKITSRPLSDDHFILSPLRKQTRAYVQQLNTEKQRAISDALHTYQNKNGDNYLMNINVLGFQTLQGYLQSLYQRPVSKSELDHFIKHFGKNYPFAQQISKNALKTRIEDTLSARTDLLADFLHNAPPFSGVTLFKGSKGNNCLFNTSLNSRQTLKSVLSGDSLMFNGFLSTSSSGFMALLFADIAAPDETGDPLYTINLAAGDTKNQALQELALNQLGTSAWQPEHVVFRLTTHNARGIHVDTLQDRLDPNSLSNIGEREILFAPGHCFRPDSVTLCSNTCLISGTLSYPHSSQRRG